MSTVSLTLPGLDGANPLGFLAAVGTLVALTEAGEKSARLGWGNDGSWRPVLAGLQDTDVKQVCAILTTELCGREVPADAEGARALAQKDFESAKTRLKKAVEQFKKRGLRGTARAEALELEISPIRREYDGRRATLLEKLTLAVPRPELAIGNKIDLTGDEFRAKAEQFLSTKDKENESASALLASFAVEGASDDRATRTSFDFVDSSGRLAFLETVRQLMALATPTRIEATLFRPWLREDERWSLRWDPDEDRRYALLDRNPTASNNKSRSEWMANLLAYRALSAFPSACTIGGAATAAWSSQGGDQVFTWPIWNSLLPIDAVRSLLGSKELLGHKLNKAALRAMGIAAVFRSRRVANGDYINFSPACGE